MEEGRGVRLDRYLSERGPLEPAKALRIAFQVAQQLAQMGSGGGSHIVHPGRILIERGGAVRLLPPPAEDLALPPMLEFPHYASPEEIRGAQPDLRSSLYSLGCTLFELLAGHPPYTGNDPRAILRAHAEAPIPDLRKEAPAVSQALAETVRELMEKDPDLRIQSVDELLRRLRHAAAGGAPPPAARSAPAPAPRAKAAFSSARRTGKPAPPLGPASRKKALRASPSRARRGLNALDEELESEDRARAVIPSRRGYPFTIGGATLGLCIGLVLALGYVRRAQKVPEIEAAAIAEYVEETRRNRKQGFQAELEKKRAVVDSYLKALQAQPEAKKRDFLLEALRKDATNPRAYLLGQALAALGPPPGAPGAPAAEDPEVTKEFQKILQEAERLYAEGKIGEAAKRIYEENTVYNLLTQDQKRIIDEKKDRWEKEIEDRWNRDKAEIENLSQQGEGEKAIEIARAAMAYGDSMLRREAEALIKSLQDQLDIQRSSVQREEEPDTGVDVEDLEKELEEHEGKDSQSGAGSDRKEETSGEGL